MRKQCSRKDYRHYLKEGKYAKWNFVYGYIEKGKHFRDNDISDAPVDHGSTSDDKKGPIVYNDPGYFFDGYLIDKKWPCIKSLPQPKFQEKVKGKEPDADQSEW